MTNYKIFLTVALSVTFVSSSLFRVSALNSETIDFERSESEFAYISDTNQSDLDLGTQFTIESWIKLESSIEGKAFVIASKGTSSGNQRAFVFKVSDDKRISLQASSIGSSYDKEVWVETDANIPINEWHHAATTFDGSNEGNEIKFFLDGNQIGATQSATISSLFDTTGAFGIGGENISGTPGDFFDGLIDEVRVWNVVRTPAEIAANKDHELVGNEPGLVGYWKFNNSLEDSTANNNDLIAVNGPTFSAETPFVDAPATPDPVIVVPGIMGSAEHNGIWEIDPILHTYDDLIDTLDANGYTPGIDLFPFPYDWHASNSTTADLLKQKIDAVKSLCSCDKVDIVAHSMGGLVARHYVQSGAYENDIDQLIFLGTPHLGAPHAYLVWEGGVTGFDWTDKPLNLILRHEAKEKGYADVVTYAHTAPVSSVQQLLPISDYLFDASVLRSYPSGYPANSFLEGLHASLGDLLSSGAHLFNFVGDVMSPTTIAGINVLSSGDIPPTWEHGKPDTGAPFVLGSGDGTVPTASASVITAGLSVKNAGHRALPDASKGDVVELLTGVPATTLIDHFDIPNLKLLMIQIFSPADLLVIAPDGAKVGKSANGGEINEITGAFYTGFSTDVEFITIPHPIDGVYKIVTHGATSGPYRIEAHYLSSTATSTAAFSGHTSAGLSAELQLPVDDENPVLLMQPSDTEGPELAISAPENREYLRSEVLPIDVSASDTETGLYSLVTKLDDEVVSNQGSIDLFFKSLGDHNVSAEAIDNVNNITNDERAFRVTADATSTRSDMLRAFSLSWMTQKIYDDLKKKFDACFKKRTIVTSVTKTVVVTGKNGKPTTKNVVEKVTKVEIFFDKKAAQDVLKALDRYRGKGLSEPGYRLLKEDIQWLIAH